MDNPVANMVLVPVDAVDQLERYEQFVDGWGDEVLGLKQHPLGNYVKFEDVLTLLRRSQPSLEEEVGEMIERLRTYRPFEGEWGDKTHHTICDEAATLLRTLSADNARLRVSVEQAFRDGLAYAGNVRNPDPDIAWEHSRAKAALDTQGGGNG